MIHRTSGTARRGQDPQHISVIIQPRGLQAMNDKSIVVPASSRLQPNKDYLTERFERFRAA